jgi:hypothetical protein
MYVFTWHRPLMNKHFLLSNINKSLTVPGHTFVRRDSIKRCPHFARIQGGLGEIQISQNLERISTTIYFFILRNMRQ